MSGAQDVGGQIEGSGPIDRSALHYSHWEKSVHATLVTLVKKGVLSLDEHR